MWHREAITTRGARLSAALALIAVLGLGGVALAGREAAPAKYQPSFLISATQASRTVVTGGKVTYALSIFQRKYRGSVSMRIISRLPAGVSSSIGPNPTSSTRSRLALMTTAATRPGTYRVRVRGYRSKPAPPKSALRSPRAMRRWRRATSGRRRMTRTVRLVVTAPAPAQPFSVDGEPTRELAPGVSAPVDVRVTNSHGSALNVRSLSMGIARIDAPRAGATLGCEVADFAIEQFSGPAFVVPPRSMRRLSELGIPASQWPRLAMLDRPVRQDGCKGATLQLSFSGTATGGS